MARQGQAWRAKAGQGMVSPDWRSAANRHLLAFIRQQAGHRIYYSHESDTARMGVAKRPHPLSVEMARILRTHAHSWALTMSEWSGDPPSAAEQREAWTLAMELADRDCRAARERSA